MPRSYTSEQIAERKRKLREKTAKSAAGNFPFAKIEEKVEEPIGKFDKPEAELPPALEQRIRRKKEKMILMMMKLARQNQKNPLNLLHPLLALMKMVCVLSSAH